MPPSKTSPRAIERAKRIDHALQMRIEGKGFRDIAKHFELSVGGAYNLVMDGIKDLYRDNAESVFDMEMERLDLAQAALVAGVRDGDPRSIEQWLKIHDKRVKLFKLDQIVTTQGDTGQSVIDRLADAIAGTYKQQLQEGVDGDSSDSDGD